MLKRLGRLFQITHERIRQIEAKTLRKLRHPSRSDMLIFQLEREKAGGHPLFQDLEETYLLTLKLIERENSYGNPHKDMGSP